MALRTLLQNSSLMCEYIEGAEVPGIPVWPGEPSLGPALAPCGPALPA